jgi:hypothetical protein
MNEMKLKINKEYRQRSSPQTPNETANNSENKVADHNSADVNYVENDFTEDTFNAATQKFKLLSLIEVHLND